MQVNRLAQKFIEAIIAKTRNGDLTWKQSDDDSYHTQIDDVALHLTIGRGRSEVTARCGKQVVCQFTHRYPQDRPALSKLTKAVSSASDAQIAKMMGVLSQWGIQTDDAATTETASDDAATTETASDGAATTETASDDAPPGGEGQ